MIMMKGLMKKVRGNKKGFTLAELLVVVAIVGILVAISIPVFTAQLSKARKATNQANLRAAKAAAIAYLTDEDVTLADKDGKIVYYEYDLDSGTSTKDGSLKTAFAAPTDYSEVADMDSATDKAKYEHIQVAIKISSDSDSTANGTEVKLYASTKK